AALERTAARAKARGGFAAAGAFMERAAVLTPELAARATRTLAAAELMYLAGALGAVDQLLGAVDPTPLDDLPAARAATLRARVALSLSGANRETVHRLLDAARLFANIDPAYARAIQLDALRAGYFLADPELPRIAADAISEHAEPETVVELMLRGWREM